MFDVFQPETSMKLSAVGPNEITEHAEEKTRHAMKAIDKAPGNHLKTAQGTAWGLLNAVIYMLDHHFGKSQDFRLRQAWFGSCSKTKQRALELAFHL